MKMTDNLFIVRQGDIIEYHLPEFDYIPTWKVIPINLKTTDNDMAIMNSGLARAFASKYPTAKYTLGVQLSTDGGSTRVFHLGVFGYAHWVAVATKHSPSDDKADMKLIESALWCLDLQVKRCNNTPVVVLPKLGCGCGKLKWNKVKSLYQRELRSTNYIVVDSKGDYDV